MIRLPFERTYWIDSNPCAKCGGSGRMPTARDVYGRSSECWTCNGLGWKPTPAGKDLFYGVLALTGVSVTRWPTRINPYLVRGRTLTPEVLQQIDALMATHIGKGAVLAPVGNTRSA